MRLSISGRLCETSPLVNQMIHDLYPHRILDCWTTFQESDVRASGKRHRVWNCDLHIVVELTLGSDRIFGGVASGLPGWVHLGKYEFELVYLGRFDHCAYCKNRGTVQGRHTYADCIARLCSHCGSSSHPSPGCPVALKAVASSEVSSLADSYASVSF